MICRKSATRDANPFTSPLSSRFDELDGQMWLDDVFVPVEPRVPHRPVTRTGGALAVLAPALLLAVEGGVHAGPGAGLQRRRWGLLQHELTIDYLLDLITDVQTVRSLPDRRRARSGHDAGRLLLAQPEPSRRRQHRHAEGAAAHGGDPAHPAGLLAGGRAERP